MTDTAAVTRLIEPEVEDLGYRLVRVAMTGGRSDPTLQIMAERPDTRQLTLQDCERLSRRLSDLLDGLEAEGRDPVSGAYRLEVSSPGIDRPLTRIQDYSDWKGHEARINLGEPLDGRKQFAGTLEGVDDGRSIGVRVKDGRTYSIPFDQIASAKLLLTDALIQATAPIDPDGADIIKTEG